MLLKIKIKLITVGVFADLLSLNSTCDIQWCHVDCLELKTVPTGNGIVLTAAPKESKEKDH